MTRTELQRRLDSLDAQREIGELTNRRHQLLRRAAKIAYKAEKPIRRQARRKVQTARERGELHRPGICEGCGYPDDLAGHHSDYSKPLRVEWLCSECHALADQQVVDPGGLWWCGSRGLLTTAYLAGRLAQTKKSEKGKRNE